jgi:hypothetical protein
VTESVPTDTLEQLRSVCLALPETREEQAWVGVRWRVRTRTFAHVLMITDGHPPAYAKAAGTDGPVTVVTFRSPQPELDALTNAGHPFFRPVWAPDVVGMIIEDDADWDEIGELLTESFCLLAPGKLVDQVIRPT